MQSALFSDQWHLVRGTRLRLREHVRLARHAYRGQIWYVLYDPLSRRIHRCTPETYAAIVMLDGNATLESVWSDLHRRLGDAAPTQDQLLDLLSGLHQADLLAGELAPDSSELVQRTYQRERWRWQQRLALPLFLTLRLGNPARLLDRCLRVMTPWVWRAACCLWGLVLLLALPLVLQSWSELTADVIDRLTTPQSLLITAVLYPVLKLLHEAGHALVARRYGCEVPEIGMTLTLGLPLPYVDATAASLLPDKYERMAVAAAGIAVDLFTASLALFAWEVLQPGLARTAAFNIMALGGLSSLCFNGNPLLRYDGYFILQDWLEIPNLATRASRHIKMLLRRHVLRMPIPSPAPPSPGEALWLLSYGLASWLFRTCGLAVLLLLAMDRYPLYGTIAAALTISCQWLLPGIRGLSGLIRQPLRGQQRLAQAALIAALALAVFVLPLPAWTLAEGVLLPPDESTLRAGAEGTVQRLLAAPGALVQAGDPLIELDDSFVRAELAVLQAREQELRSRYNAKWHEDPVAADRITDDLESVQAAISRTHERIANLTVHSPTPGRLLLPEADDLPGRFVRQGAALGYVVAADAPLRAQVLVSQDRIARVRDHTRDIAVLPAIAGAEPIAARIARATPQAVTQLPSSALGPRGGGSFIVDPADPESRKTLDRYFEYELELQGANGVERFGIGARVCARFEHSAETLATRAYRSLRQLLLRRVDV